MEDIIANLENGDEKIKIGEGELTLAQLAGFDLSDTKAKRFENFPEGHFLWEITADPMPTLQVAGGKGMAIIPCKALDVLALKDGTIDAAAWIGKIHREVKVLTTLDSIEYFVASIQDLGGNTKQPLLKAMHALVGTKFKAGIKWRTDPNDKDKVYAQLSKIEVVEKPTTSTVAQAIAG